jgi:hypothetical protein
MTGHALLQSTDPQCLKEARREYAAAAALTPDDPMTASLAAEVGR